LSNLALPPGPSSVITIHTLDGPSDATAATDPLRAIVGEFLAGYGEHTRLTYADHLGYPWRVTATRSRPVGAPRDVSRLRNGVAFLRWCAAHDLDPLADVTRRQILAWVEDVKASRNSAGEPLDDITIGQMVSCVSTFYDWSARYGHDGADSEVTYSRVQQPVVLDRRTKRLATKTAESPTRSLIADEVAQLQRVADHDPARYADPLRTGTWVALLFELGLRIDELTSLHRDDMSVMAGERVVTVTGKGGRRRTLKVTRATAARIDRYLAHRDMETGTTVPALRGQVSYKHQPLIAARAHKTRELVAMRNGDCAKKLKALAILAGIEDPDSITPHVARHTWATIARLADVPESTIQTHFGHADAATTGRYGKHVALILNSPVDQVAAALETALIATFAAHDDQHPEDGRRA
jgi:integrase/recombinase XerD